MGVPARHILSQGPVLAALGRTVAVAARQRLSSPAPAMPELPGPELRRELSPRPRALIDSYLKLVGGDPRAYRGTLPPHLFPQWCFPLLARTLESAPYPLLGIVNGGCRVQVNAPMRDDEPIGVRARLESIDDDGRKAVFHQRIVTGTAAEPEALEIDVYPIVVHGRGEASSGTDNGSAPKKERARVPANARELARLRLRPETALDYAKATGDFNPIHWVAPYARASGFRSVIMHGFGQLALSWEALVRAQLGGDPHALSSFDVKFTRPLPLPREVGLYRDGSAIYLGDAPQSPAYLTGTYGTRP
jgi:acyl dehydratase